VRLEVHPLDVVGQRALIEQQYVLAAPDQERLEQYLFDRAQGNPLYASELLHALEDEGVLRRDAEGWELGGLEQRRMPQLLMQVIEGRLARLSDETRELLQIAAVIGQMVPVDLWQAVSGASDETLVRAIEEGQAAQVLVEVAGGAREQFRHALLREALYQELVALRRRLWHRQVADVIIQTSNPDPDMVAHHFQQAGDRRATEWLFKAGERARRAYSWVTATERFEAALALMTEQGVPAGEQAIVVFRIATLARYVDPRRAVTLMREARRLAEAADEAGLATRCLIDEGLYQCFLGELRDGLATMEQGVRKLETLSEADRERLASISGLPLSEINFSAGSLVLWLSHSGRLQDAVALGEQQTSALAPPTQRASQSGSPYADCWLGLATAYASLGKPQLAQQALTRARSAYEAIDHHSLTAATYLWELLSLQLPYAADQPAEQLRLLSVEGTATFQRASGANPQGLPARSVAIPLLLLQGDWDEAKVAATQAYGRGLKIAFWYGACDALARLAWAQGDAALVGHITHDLIPGGPATEPGNDVLWIVLLLQRLAATMALDTGDLPTARAWLEAHDRWLQWSGVVPGRADGALGWAAYHHASGDPASARAAASQALAHATEPRQPLALLAVHRFLGKLDTEADQFDTADEHLTQSLALTEACSAPFERALTLLEIARLRIAVERSDDARTLLAEVRAICEPLEAKPTLERVAALQQRLGGPSAVLDG
jgi:hypothetical protein